MKRTPKIIKPVTAILTADWHLREDVPVCRIDDFVTAQWSKVFFIAELQKKYNCPVIHSGDLFDHWKPSPALLSKTIEYIPKKFYTVYGNHDLPQHSMELKHKSGVHTLATGGHINLLEHGHFGESEPRLGMLFNAGDVNMAVWHTFTYMGKEPWPGCESPTGNKLLRKYKDFDLIVTGDNHQSFFTEDNGRLLVNPGSITRQTAKQHDFKPCVYLWHSEDNTVTRVYLPIDEDAVSREHLEKTEQRNERLESFISKLDGDWEAGISFEENIERFKQKNKVNKHVMEIIYKALEV